MEKDSCTVFLSFLLMKNDGRVFIQSWRWDPPKLSRKFPSFSQNDFETFLGGGYPNRSSDIHRWGLDLSTRYPNTYFSWFSRYPQLTLVFLRGDKILGYLPEVPVTKIRVLSPAPKKKKPDRQKTSISSETFRWPQPSVFSKSTAVQMGGVLPYKWEAYRSTNGRRIAGFPFLRSLEARKVRRYKRGAYCRTNWRCTAVLFRPVVGVGVSETLPISDFQKYRERGNRALVIVFESRQFLRLRNAFKYSVFEASKMVSTKTLLLKHYHRRQGNSLKRFLGCSEADSPMVLCARTLLLEHPSRTW